MSMDEHVPSTVKAGLLPRNERLEQEQLVEAVSSTIYGRSFRLALLSCFGRFSAASPSAFSSPSRLPVLHLVEPRVGGRENAIPAPPLDSRLYTSLRLS